MSLSSLRQLPSVDRLLGEPTLQELIPIHGHRLVVTAVRQVLTQIREAVRDGAQLPAQNDLVAQVEGVADAAEAGAIDVAVDFMDRDAQQAAAASRVRLLNENIDLTRWMVEFFERFEAP